MSRQSLGRSSSVRASLTQLHTSSKDREEQIKQARLIWSQGFIAQEIEDFCKNNEFMDTTEKRHKGLLTGEDLAGWSATIEKVDDEDEEV